MDHRDHVGLIRAGIEGAGPYWLELGSGSGAFTLALADLLGPGGRILVSDREVRAVHAARAAVEHRFPEVQIEARSFDHDSAIPYGPFDGVLAANTLHFTRDRDATLRAIRFAIRPGGRLVVVEYDADHGNPWVPHPFSFETWRGEAARAGYGEPRLIGRVPSRFLGAIYGAVAEVPASGRSGPGGPGAGPQADVPVLHSAPHGRDREE
jgi:SAM-dependent methyltransferase